MENKNTSKTILKVATVTSFITTFMGSSLNLSIPNLENEFGVSAAMIGWVVTAYTLAVAAASVPLGKIADAKGRRTMFIWGILLFGVFSLLSAFSPALWFLMVMRVLQGLSAAMIFATNNAILISAFPSSERGRVLGITTAAVYVGLSLGPVIGGFLNSHIGWRSIFILAALICVFSFFLAARGIPKSEEGLLQGDMDVWGNILYMLMIVVTLYGLTNLSIMKYAWVIVAAGVFFGVLFVLTEKKAKNPVIKISMFTENLPFALSNLAALLNYGATFAISYLMSIYLQVVMGYSSQIAGFILIVQPVIQAAFSPMMGRLSDKIMPYKLASAGMGLCAVGLIMFSLISVDSSIWLVIASLATGGFGFALFSSPNTNAIMALVDPSDYSIANSILATMRTVGHSSSMAIVTIVVGITLGNTALAAASGEAIVATMHKCFIIFVVLCILGVFMSLKRTK